jgi:hypothetical protein
LNDIKFLSSHCIRCHRITFLHLLPQLFCPFYFLIHRLGCCAFWLENWGILAKFQDQLMGYFFNNKYYKHFRENKSTLLRKLRFCRSKTFSSLKYFNTWGSISTVLITTSQAWSMNVDDVKILIQDPVKNFEILPYQ